MKTVVVALQASAQPLTQSAKHEARGEQGAEGTMGVPRPQPWSWGSLAPCGAPPTPLRCPVIGSDMTAQAR